MEHKNKRRKGNIGNQNNARVRKILSIKAKARYKNKEFKTKFLKIMASPERKEKLSNRCKEWHKNKTPEQEAIRRQKISEKSKLQWKNGNKGYHPNKILAYNHSRRTFPEMIMANALRKNKIKFNEQQHVGKFFPDFVIKNIIVEVDGEKWHTDKQYKYNRDRYLRRRGYHILHFSATAVIHKTQNCITIILNKIEKVKIKC